jgi:glycosyltransferase involved in cell wall biosynthesis
LSSEHLNNNRPTVLFLNSWYPNRTNDTLGNFVEKHILAISPHVNAYAIAVFSDENCSEVSLEIHHKEAYVELIVYYPKVNKLPFLKPYRFFKACLVAWKYLQKNKVQPSLIHVNVAFPMALFALWLKRKYHLPTVVTEHSTAYSRMNTKIPKFQRLLAKRLFQKANHILPVSKDLHRGIEHLGVKNQFTVVPNVVDTRLFTLKSKQTKLENYFIHISTANDEQKNLTGIIDVFSELMIENQTIYLQIVSDGPLDKFKFLAERLKINPKQMTFTGKSKTEEVANYLQKSDALVLFSNYENFPCVIPESFAVGIPVISTNVNGIPEYVNETNGILINPKAKDELKQAILTFITNKDQFNSQDLRKYAEQEFSFEAVGLKMMAIYQQVLHVS